MASCVGGRGLKDFNETASVACAIVVSKSLLDHSGFIGVSYARNSDDFFFMYMKCYFSFQKGRIVRGYRVRACIFL